MWCHLIPVLTSVLGFGLFAFLGPLLIRQHNKGRSSFVDEHARDSLNFQISILLYIGIFVAVSLVVVLATFGLGIILLIPAIFIFGFAAIGILVLEIIATIKAANGEFYKYILTIQFVK